MVMRSTVAVLSALFLIGGCATFQPGDSRGTVVGMVYGGGYEPVGGAELVLYAPGSNRAVTTATSDRQGRFTLDELPFGTYELVATHPDYVEQRAAIRLTESGQLVHVLMQSLIRLEEDVAQLIRGGKPAAAREAIAAADAQTPVLRFLEAAAAFAVSDYAAVLESTRTLRKRYPEMEELAALERRARAARAEARRSGTPPSRKGVTP